jgi:hypothetical protein
MPIKGILASSASKAARFWSYPTTTVTASRYQAVASSSNVTALGGRTSNGTDQDNFVVSYDKSGNINWQLFYNVGVGGTDSIVGIDVDSSRNVYALSAGAAINESFVKFDATGAQQWARGTTYSILSSDLKIDPSGNIYIVGGFTITTQKYRFLMKLSSTPTVTWISAENYGTTGSVRTDSFLGIAIDSGSNVYAAGNTQDAAGDINAATLFKFNSSGAIQWGRNVGTSGGDGSRFSDCGVDSADNVYVAGQRSSGTAATLAKFNSSGTVQWTRNSNNSGWDALSVDSAGNCYVARNEILMKFNSSGTLQWQRTIKYNTTLNTTINALKIDEGNNSINVAGYIGTSGYPLFASLPTDGSGTGTYTVGIYTINYAAASQTITSPTPTYGTPSFTPFTTAPGLTTAATAITTTTYANNKTVIL